MGPRSDKQGKKRSGEVKSLVNAQGIISVNAGAWKKQQNDFRFLL